MSGAQPWEVVVLDDYQGVAGSIVDWSASSVPLRVTMLREHLEGDALLAALETADVIVATRERTALPAALLARLPRLRLVVTTGSANAAIEPTPSLTLCGTRLLASPTPELTWALILAAERNLVEEAGAMPAGGWQRTLGLGLEGRTLGLLGLGNVGARVARVGLAFGMRVIAWSANLDDARAAEVGVERVDRDALFSSSDVLSIHTRLGDRTRGIVDAAMLARMRPGALLVNTSRGPIIDEGALLEALRAGRIRAALDVFDVEPLPADAPIRDAPGVLLTPHLGYVTEQNHALAFADALECIERFAAGAPVRTIHAPTDGARQKGAP